VRVQVAVSLRMGDLENLKALGATVRLSSHLVSAVSEPTSACLQPTMLTLLRHCCGTVLHVDTGGRAAATDLIELRRYELRSVC